jgi:hypothetical protein
LGQSFQPGSKTWYASDSPGSTLSAVFEDDGDTGYLYAYDRSMADAPILDAVLIYNAKTVADREAKSFAEVAWSTDGLKAVLLINDSPHAVINFSQRCSYCRTVFPPPSGPWRHEAWNDALMEWF